MPGWLARLLGLFSKRQVDPVPSSGPPLVVEINRARVSRGCPSLVEDAPLSELAQSWAVECARRGRLDHGDFMGRVFGVYPNVPAAENLAAGPPDAAGVVQMWLDSSGHRTNMLGPYDHLGVGVALGNGMPFDCAVFAKLGT